MGMLHMVVGVMVCPNQGDKETRLCVTVRSGAHVLREVIIGVAGLKAWREDSMTSIDGEVDPGAGLPTGIVSRQRSTGCTGKRELVAGVALAAAGDLMTRMIDAAAAAPAVMESRIRDVDTLAAHVAETDGDPQHTDAVADLTVMAEAEGTSIIAAVGPAVKMEQNPPRAHVPAALRPTREAKVQSIVAMAGPPLARAAVTDISTDTVADHVARICDGMHTNSTVADHVAGIGLECQSGSVPAVHVAPIKALTKSGRNITNATLQSRVDIAKTTNPRIRRVMKLVCRVQ